MSEAITDNVINVFGEEGERFLTGRTQALSDEEMAGVSGGVGNAGEGTCWYCGKPAVWNGSVWFCKDCHKGTSLDDAQTILSQLPSDCELIAVDDGKGKF